MPNYIYKYFGGGNMHIWKYIGLIGCIAILSSSINSTTCFGKDKHDVKVGLIHTFSKSDPMCYDPYGKNLLNGVNMAWDDFVRKNSQLKFRIKFVQYDMADSRIKAIEQIKKAHAEGVSAVIGYVCSDLALLGGPEAQRLKIPMITPSGSDDRIAQIGDYVFMASFNNSYQGKTIANFSYNELKKKKTLIIKAVDCPYCVSLANAYRDSFESLGGKIVDELNILEKDRDFSRISEKIAKYKFDSIFLPNYAMQVAGLISSILKAGVQTVFLGGDAWIWTKKSFDIIGDTSFVGYSVTTWLPDYPTEVSKDFVKRYYKKYGKDITDTAPHSYDAAMLLFNALKRTRIFDGVHIKDALYGTEIIDGVTGKLIFNHKNHPKRPIMVMKSSNYKQEILRIISPK